MSQSFERMRLTAISVREGDYVWIGNDWRLVEEREFDGESTVTLHLEHPEPNHWSLREFGCCDKLDIKRKTVRKTTYTGDPPLERDYIVCEACEVNPRDRVYDLGQWKTVTSVTESPCDVIFVFIDGSQMIYQLDQRVCVQPKLNYSNPIGFSAPMQNLTVLPSEVKKGDRVTVFGDRRIVERVEYRAELDIYQLWVGLNVSLNIINARDRVAIERPYRKKFADELQEGDVILYKGERKEVTEVTPDHTRVVLDDPGCVHHMGSIVEYIPDNQTFEVVE